MTSGFDGDRPGDAQALLLAARQRHARLLELVLDVVPERGAAEAALDELVHVALVAVDPRPEGDVLVDRLRERVRLLEDHPDAAADGDRIDRLREQVLAVEQDPALGAVRRDEVVHPVDRPQQRRLAAAGRADQRGDRVLGDLDVDVADRPERAVVARHVLELDDVLAARSRGRRRRRRAAWSRSGSSGRRRRSTVRGRAPPRAGCSRGSPLPLDVSREAGPDDEREAR